MGRFYCAASYLIWLSCRVANFGTIDQGIEVYHTDVYNLIYTFEHIVSVTLFQWYMKSASIKTLVKYFKYLFFIKKKENVRCHLTPIPVHLM